uniref:Uncharacterized protein n=1 Tax=viral metagenome TaxID=1070528 RepID=A0A6C0LRU1_9ZZZZ
MSLSHHFPIQKEFHHIAKNANAIDRLNSEIELKHIISHSIIKSLYSDPKIRIPLIKLILLIEPWIYLHINMKLIDLDHLPLIGGEIIELILNGNSAINYYFSLVKLNISKIDRKLHDFYDEYANLFNIEDFNFTIRIKTNDSNRFEIIEKIVNDSILEFYDIVANILDNLLIMSNSRKDLEIMFKTKHNKNLNLSIDYDSLQLINIKKIMAYENFDFSCHLLFNPSEKNKLIARKSNIKTINQISSFINEMSNYKNILIFEPYLYYFSNFNKKNIEKINIRSNPYRIKIINEINSIALELNSADIYSNSRITLAIHSVISDLSKHTGNIFYKKYDKIDITSKEYQEDTFFQKIVLSNNIKPEICKSLSYYKYNDIYGIHENVLELFSQPSMKLIIPVQTCPIVERYHSIYVDQSLGDRTRMNNYVRDEDTLSLHINLKLDNILINSEKNKITIPINLYNIKIIRYESSHYFDEVTSIKFNKINVSIEKKYNILIKIPEKQELIHYLIKMLFDDRSYLPWYEPSYFKYIVKIFFLIYLDNPSCITFLSDLLSKKININHIMYFEENEDMYSFYNLIWLDHQIVSKYYEIEYIIKFIIILEEISKLPFEKSNKLFHKFHNIYEWDDSNENLVDDILKEFTNFKKELIGLVKLFTNDS